MIKIIFERTTIHNMLFININGVRIDDKLRTIQECEEYVDDLYIKKGIKVNRDIR